jgi:hypothetical protein
VDPRRQMGRLWAIARLPTRHVYPRIDRRPLLFFFGRRRCLDLLAGHPAAAGMNLDAAGPLLPRVPVAIPGILGPRRVSVAPSVASAWCWVF